MTVKPSFLRIAAPDHAQQPQTLAPEIDALSDRLGFVDRAPAPTVRRKKARLVDEPQTSFTMRISVAAANAFVAWTEAEKISYREGFDRLISKIAHN